MISAGARILKGVELGENVRIEPGVVIYGPTKISAGSYVGANTVIGFPTQEELRQSSKIPSRSSTIVGESCVVRSGSTLYKSVTLGARVRTGHNVMVRENVRVGDDTLLGTNLVVDGDCRIGKHVSIQSGVYICTNCTIEDYVFLGPHCVFTNDKFVMRKGTELVGPTVRRKASVGANVLLMPAVEIGEASVVGAQALVTRNVPSRTIVAGVPARRMKEVPDDWKSLLREKCLKNGCHK